MSMNFSFPASALCLSSPSLRRIGSAKVQTFLLLPNISQSFFYFFLSITPQKPCKESFITVFFLHSFYLFFFYFAFYRLFSGIVGFFSCIYSLILAKKLKFGVCYSVIYSPKTVDFYKYRRLYCNIW